MGCHQSSSAQSLISLQIKQNKHLIKVLTLNYCGILKSPFQFYSGQYLPLLQALSKTFIKLLPKYVNPNEKGQYEWNFAKIDKRMGSKRYSPVYLLKAMLSQNIKEEKFLSKKEYITIWQQRYNQEVKKLEITADQNQKKQALLFDLLTLHTLLANAYDNINQIDDILTQKPQAYLKKYGPLFQQSFLNEQKKSLDLLLKINNYDFDILFLQEGSDGLLQNLSKISKFYLQVSNDKNTLIIINKNKFRSYRSASSLMSALSQEQRKKLNWNGHTSMALADNYILLNCHLSSKPKINQQNMKQMKQSLLNLKQKFPSYEIICGGDANNFVTNFDSSFHIYPDIQSKFTSLKKRSYLQVQFSKSEKVIKTAKDHIISTLDILKGEIVTIEGQVPTQRSFLPLDEHPYDHFLVKVDFIRKDTL